MNAHSVKAIGLAGILIPLWLCAACGGSSNEAAPTATPTGRVECVGLGRADGSVDNVCQTLSPEQAAATDLIMGPSYPVCGTGLGPSYKGLGVIGPLDRFLGTDASQAAPTPAPIEYAWAGRFVLKLTPDCKKGADVRFEPPSAAEITGRAVAADGRLAGVGIRAHVQTFRIIGTGAVAFDQRVELACPMADACPADPRKDDGVADPTVSPEPTPGGRWLNP